ncbi:PIN domain-containing protein [Sphingomonas sp. PR090111-T3T-6A]|uniref:PIN domain-containing protein n=1 Tax=Sphingomonas sp. PR090111-T3T-6A TaxID=685778 RepID=UPI0003A8D9D1|nr:PIN domain-containing protein [Sphingomonas sp. PR090111-T3T-6A]
MTLYLIDLNVLQEMGPKGNSHVRAWLATVDDDALRLSALTFFEKREGLERERKRRLAKGADWADVDLKLAEIAKLETLFEDRVIPVGTKEYAEWAKLVGVKGKNQRDAGLAATARVNDLVVVTRNVKDFAGRDVRVLNPFVAKPTIVIV